MGMLGNQDPRDHFHVDLDRFLAEVKVIAKKHGVSIESFIEAKRVLEMDRRNSLAVQNGDYLDEQLGGFGDKLSEIASAITESGS